MSIRRRSTLVLVPILVLPLAAAARAAAPAGTGEPCLVQPWDGSFESTLGAPSTENFEICSQVEAPPECVAGGWTYVTRYHAEVTRGITGGLIFDGTGRMRRSAAGSPPGAVHVGPLAIVLAGVPLFPATIAFDAEIDPGRETHAAFQDLYACIVVDGSSNPDQGLAVDESTGTSPITCWSGPPPPGTACTVANPSLKAVTLGAQFSPYSAAPDGDQEVPPVTTPATGRVRMGPIAAGSEIYWIRIEHDVAGVTAAHIHFAQPGLNGPVIFDLGDPASPIVRDDVTLTGFADELMAGALYVNIHSAAAPAGEIRGRLTPAGFLFSDGFETGDTTVWSFAVP